MAQTKREKAIKAAVVPGKAYAFEDAINILKTATKAKFVESFDVAVRLGVDAKKSDQQVRGSTVLPAGTGKSVRVAVFAPAGAKADEALAAGAEAVGMDDLAEKMQAGDLNYDVVIATPDAMRVVGKLGTVLGPRGLMPNPKVGTVTPDVATAVKNAKAGQVQFRVDKAEQAKAAGAEIVGMEDLAEQIKAGKMDFDVVIASPDTMRVVGTLGQILGPRGLMPNPKVGTVTPNVAQAVKDAKGGAVEFRVEKAGIVHAGIGKVSFTQDALEANVKAIVDALVRSKPSGAKGTYVKRISLSSTMGPGFKVDPSSLGA